VNLDLFSSRASQVLEPYGLEMDFNVKSIILCNTTGSFPNQPQHTIQKSGANVHKFLLMIAFCMPNRGPTTNINQRAPHHSSQYGSATLQGIRNTFSMGRVAYAGRVTSTPAFWDVKRNECGEKEPTPLLFVTNNGNCSPPLVAAQSNTTI